VETHSGKRFSLYSAPMRRKAQYSIALFYLKPCYPSKELPNGFGTGAVLEDETEEERLSRVRDSLIDTWRILKMEMGLKNPLKYQ